MPQGWWTNQEIIESGRKIYLGNEKSNVNCSRCHGENGVPNVRGAPDFRNTQSMKKYSDSHLFWRITEGVPYSSMSPYRGTLSEEQIWKVIAFIGSLGMGGLHYDPETKSWVPAG
jgi:mono/diheme cytochrome c family protein